ncbi:hypothetical protein EDC01DRAFT_628922 [Geopyxis carbonaria]|nr:hypothetical protein EDC01DRAFT_628922 [Geopyxis carbonaria]
MFFENFVSQHGPGNGHRDLSSLYLELLLAILYLSQYNPSTSSTFTSVQITRSHTVNTVPPPRIWHGTAKGTLRHRRAPWYSGEIYRKISEIVDTVVEMTVTDVVGNTGRIRSFGGVSEGNGAQLSYDAVPTASYIARKHDHRYTQSLANHGSTPHPHNPDNSTGAYICTSHTSHTTPPYASTVVHKQSSLLPIYSGGEVINRRVVTRVVLAIVYGCALGMPNGYGTDLGSVMFRHIDMISRDISATVDMTVEEVTGRIWSFDGVSGWDAALHQVARRLSYLARWPCIFDPSGDRSSTFHATSPKSYPQ